MKLHQLHKASKNCAIALRCEDVHKSYPLEQNLRLWRVLLGRPAGGMAHHALRGISLSVPRGKIVGILGKNGAGKSTLLRVLAGVYPPTSGLIEANGQVAGLFELGGMNNPHLTGREFATRYLLLMGAREAELKPILDEICEFSELGPAFDQRIRTYSSGMGARLYFATATAIQHEIYLIDELLAVGDEHFQAKCWKRMRDRLLGGASGILVTHDWPAILKLCEQAHVLEQGRFAFSGASDRAVVSYLKLPQPSAKEAAFSNVPLEYAATSGNDTRFRFPVVVRENVGVDFSMSIEMLRIGIGWEIVLLTGNVPVADRPGVYEVDVSIPRLPLAPGKYSLNVFLSSRKNGGQCGEITFDARSWTLGNGLRLHVEGEAVAAAACLPFVVRQSEGTRNPKEGGL